MRKLTANAIGGKDVSPRQEPDALRMKREIRVFPALAHAYTKNDERHDADAGVRRVCGIYGVQRMRNGINPTVSPLGREADQYGRPRKIWKTWSKAERLSILERRKRPLLTTSAKPIPCLRKAFMTD